MQMNKQNAHTKSPSKGVRSPIVQEESMGSIFDAEEEINHGVIHW